MLVPGKCEQTKGPRINQDGYQGREAVHFEVLAQLRDIFPTTRCQPTTVAGDDVPIQVELSAMRVNDLRTAVFPLESGDLLPVRQMAQVEA